MHAPDAAPEPSYAASPVESDLTELLLPGDLTQGAALDLDEGTPDARPLFEGAALPVLLALSIYAVLRSLAFALTKHLWFDELATQIVSRQRGFSAVWNALKIGADGNPPPFYFVERAAAALPFDEHIAYRAPAILAFPVTLVCLYFFLRRNDGPMRALVSASVVLLSQMFTWFAAEARPYAMLSACVAFALLCYQRAPRRSWTFGLFLSLTAAVCLHYYAVFAILPFLAAEFVLTCKLRRPRVAVWLALFLSFGPLVIFWKLLAATKAYYGPHVWSSAQLQLPTVIDSYAQFFGTDEPWGLLLAGLCIVVIVLSLWRKRPLGASGDTQEQVLALGFVALPAVVYFAADITHGAVVPRYALCAVFGVAMAMRYVLRPLQSRAVLAGAAVVFFAIGIQEVSFWISSDFRTPPGEAASSLRSLAASVHRDALPIVVSDPLAYLEIQHYASPELKRRLVAVADPEAAIQYVQTDSADKGLLALRQLTPLNVQSLSAVTASNHTFLLYSDHTDYEWSLTQLTDDGDAPRLLAYQDPDSLYLVEMSPH